MTAIFGLSFFQENGTFQPELSLNKVRREKKNS